MDSNDTQAMTIDPAQVERYAVEILGYIDDDIAEGHVPADVDSFSALHDHVDANTYTIDAGVPWNAGDNGNDYVNAVTARVSAMLAARIGFIRYELVIGSGVGPAFKYSNVMVKTRSEIIAMLSDMPDAWRLAKENAPQLFRIGMFWPAPEIVFIVDLEGKGRVDYS